MVREVRVVVLADVRLYRDGLALVLSGRPGLAVVGKGPADRDGGELAGTLAPDIVLMEAPAVFGTTIVQELGTVAPHTRVIAYGVAEGEQEAIQCAEAGASGFVPKHATTDDLVAVVHSVAAGEFPCSPRVTSLLLRRISDLAAERRAVGASSPLTPREREIGDLLGEGLSNKDIATRLGIQISTVKNHVHNLLEKLNSSGRFEAAAHLRRARI